MVWIHGLYISFVNDVARFEYMMVWIHGLEVLVLYLIFIALL